MYTVDETGHIVPQVNKREKICKNCGSTFTHKSGNGGKRWEARECCTFSCSAAYFKKLNPKKDVQKFKMSSHSLLVER